MQNTDNQKKYKVLFVCLGNICRSSAAEGIFKKMIEEEKLGDKISADSAGTAGYHQGELPDPRMRSHGARRGYKFDSLSRKFHVSDFDQHDIIVAMDDNNYRDILRLSPDLDSDKKVCRMTDFLQHLEADHIPDPYYSGADGFELVLDLLEDGCRGLLEKIKKDEL